MFGFKFTVRAVFAQTLSSSSAWCLKKKPSSLSSCIRLHYIEETGVIVSDSDLNAYCFHNI